MSDFLTLAQHWVNVIWLISALSGIQHLKDFHKKYDLIYISDNDKAWEDSIKKFRELWLKFWHYKISIDNIKDVNDS